MQAKQGEERLVGQVDAIIFENPTNFYKVVAVAVDTNETSFMSDGTMTLTGQMATLHYDTEYEFFGYVTSHPKYGQQFQVNRYQQLTPTSEEGLIDYLSSYRFKGVGEVLASRIVEALGESTIDQIIENRRVLDSIKGLKAEVADQIHQTLMENQGTERIFMQLNQWGFGSHLAEKIYSQFESKTLEVIHDNPYQLIEQVEGIGFNKADDLAESLAIDALASQRLVAGLYTAVYQVSNNQGDTFLSQDQALKKAQEILETSRPVMVSQDLLVEALEEAIRTQHLMRLDQGIMLPSLYHAETNIARRIRDFLKYEAVERYPNEDIQQAIDQVILQTGINYDPDQIAAIKQAISAPMSIITGGPGTGKTTLINAIIQVHAILHDYDLSQLDQNPNQMPILLAAPTGRAAKRMQETTGLPAATIHRMIGYTLGASYETFIGQELDGTLLVVDEMSMVDTWLMNWLVQAIPYHLQVVFVGDRDQLPSVGPGRVFADMIESRTLATTELNRIYRQAQDSSIIDLAHHIRQGQLPKDFQVKHNDRTFIPAPTNQIVQLVQQIVGHALNKGFSAQTMQILAPMYKGSAGINQLNTMLQDLLNPQSPQKIEYQHFNRIFREGDKVLQLVNNSEDGVYNGDIGQIIEINLANKKLKENFEMLVQFDDQVLAYKTGDLNNLALAYCMSIHKAQGSEYPLVILPIVNDYYRMLRKDILYTAVTRAQDSLILLGSLSAFQKAVSSGQVKRKTFLLDLLKVAILGIDQVDDNNSVSPIPEDHKETSEARIELKSGQEESAKKIKEIKAAQEAGLQELGVRDKIEEAVADYHLTMDNYQNIDPMIGMEGIKL